MKETVYDMSNLILKPPVTMLLSPYHVARMVEGVTFKLHGSSVSRNKSDLPAMAVAAVWTVPL